MPFDEIKDHLPYNWRASKATSCKDLKASLPSFILAKIETDIVNLRSRVVFLCTTHRDFEFARQISEFRMKS